MGETIKTPTVGWDHIQFLLAIETDKIISPHLEDSLKLHTSSWQFTSLPNDTGIFAWTLDPNPNYHGRSFEHASYPQVTILARTEGSIGFAGVVPDSIDRPHIVAASYNPKGILTACGISADSGDIQQGWFHNHHQKQSYRHPLSTTLPSDPWIITKPMIQMLDDNSVLSHFFFTPHDPRQFCNTDGNLVFAQTQALKKIKLPYRLSTIPNDDNY